MKNVNWDKSCSRATGGMRSSSSLAVRSSRGQPEVRQERQEIREYLDKLRQLVPACPKAGKLSRLAVIQHVIDYIVELQDTLVHHPVNTILATNDDITNFTNSLHNPLFALQQINANKGCSPASTPAAVTKSSSNSSSSSSSSNKNSSTTTTKKTSSCRRPLGVLSSLKNHRTQ
ncbi:DNA-binding protein inhibitor ID-2-like [Cherax quadricarinatus]|uniref:DNA-binding protein inhibitor ID-2-like n=1 Tax=Cherax quadricarinatus TaxID=27406 RepID=UPI00387E33E8